MVEFKIHDMSKKYDSNMKTRSFSEAGSKKHKQLVGNISREGSLKEKGNKKS